MHSVGPWVASVHIAQPESFGFEGAAAWFDEPWTSAIFKRAVQGPVAVSASGLAGDRQADLVNHGGTDKAICVYPGDHYARWHVDLAPELPGDAANAVDTDTGGAFGENLTVRNQTETDVCVGDVYAVGATLVVQVSQPRQPCWKLARKWRVRDLATRAIATGRTGWYVRVLHGGTVCAGDRLTLLDRPHPAWTVAAANAVMHHRRGDAQALAAIETLSEAWKQTLRRRPG